MTEEFGTEVEACLDELMDPHIAAQMATADAVRAWDDRRAAGEVTSVAYANGLLAVARHEEAGRPTSENEADLFGGLPVRDTGHPERQ